MSVQCEECNEPISDEDIASYREEAGDDSNPRICEECNERIDGEERGLSYQCMLCDDDGNGADGHPCKVCASSSRNLRVVGASNRLINGSLARAALLAEQLSAELATAALVMKSSEVDAELTAEVANLASYATEQVKGVREVRKSVADGLVKSTLKQFNEVHDSQKQGAKS